jgi:hypothetical protein
LTFGAYYGYIPLKKVSRTKRDPIPRVIRRLIRKLAKRGVLPDQTETPIAQVLINTYRPGAFLKPHKDAPQFARPFHVLSLGASGSMKWFATSPGTGYDSYYWGQGDSEHGTPQIRVGRGPPHAKPTDPYLHERIATETALHKRSVMTCGAGYGADGAYHAVVQPPQPQPQPQPQTQTHTEDGPNSDNDSNIDRDSGYGSDDSLRVSIVFRSVNSDGKYLHPKQFKRIRRVAGGLTLASVLLEMQRSKNSRLLVAAFSKLKKERGSLKARRPELHSQTD